MNPRDTRGRFLYSGLTGGNLASTRARTVCLVEGCGSQAHRRGMCRSCNQERLRAQRMAEQQVAPAALDELHAAWRDGTHPKTRRSGRRHAWGPR